VRREALEALGKIGPDAVEAIPGIVAISVDFTDPLREVAMEVLALVSPPDG
jgi:hypothetical protein